MSFLLEASAATGAGAVQRLRDLTVSRAGGSTAAKTVAKGPRAFQEQNCHGWAARNEPPHHAPASRPSPPRKAPDLRPKRRSSADRAQAQNLDAAPPPPMHHVGIERHDNHKSELFDLALPTFSPSPHFHRAAIAISIQTSLLFAIIKRCQP